MAKKEMVIALIFTVISPTMSNSDSWVSDGWAGLASPNTPLPCRLIFRCIALDLFQVLDDFFGDHGPVSLSRVKNRSHGCGPLRNRQGYGSFVCGVRAKVPDNARRSHAQAPRPFLRLSMKNRDAPPNARLHGRRPRAPDLLASIEPQRFRLGAVDYQCTSLAETFNNVAIAMAFTLAGRGMTMPIACVGVRRCASPNACSRSGRLTWMHRFRR